MDFRHTMKGRTALSAVAAMAGLFLAAGCGGGGDDGSDDKGASSPAPGTSKSDDGKKESGAPSPDPVLAEVKGQEGVSLSISSATRDQGGFVTVEGTVTNGTGRAWS